jgi:hypothetical protein
MIWLPIRSSLKLLSFRVERMRGAPARPTGLQARHLEPPSRTRAERGSAAAALRLRGRGHPLEWTMLTKGLAPPNAVARWPMKRSAGIGDHLPIGLLR